MKKYYLTFGQGHMHHNGKFDKDTICEITAKSNDHAREIAFLNFGDKWFTVYGADQLDHLLKYFPKGVVKL